MDEKSGTILLDYLMVFGFPAKRLLSISITISISIPTYTFNLKQQLLLRNKKDKQQFFIFRWIQYKSLTHIKDTTREGEGCR